MPLAGVHIVEMEAVGGAPYAVDVLRQLGAEVTRVCRPGGSDLGFPTRPENDFLVQGRTLRQLDLKSPKGRSDLLELAAGADVLVESYRPGVMERLGLGPAECHAGNPELIYARFSGFGQDGPWAGVPGHDINYVGLTGILAAVTDGNGHPVVPLNLVGDFGGGAMHLALAITAALRAVVGGEREITIDVSMTDGAMSLASMILGLRADGQWRPEPRTNVLDGGAPYYRAYRTSDGRHLAVGAIEARFYRNLLDALGLADDPVMRAQHDRAQWPAQHATFERVFGERPYDDWVSLLEPVEACVTGIRTFAEAARAEPLRSRMFPDDPDGPPRPVARITAASTEGRA
jgi:alpha-methylacyl-CoA racemase